MGKVRKLIDIEREDIPYLQMLAARHGKPLKNLLEELIHQVAVTAKNEEFINRVEELKNKQ